MTEDLKLNQHLSPNIFDNDLPFGKDFFTPLRTLSSCAEEHPTKLLMTDVMSTFASWTSTSTAIILVLLVVAILSVLWLTLSSSVPSRHRAGSSLPSPKAPLPSWLGVLGGHTLLLDKEKVFKVGKSFTKIIIRSARDRLESTVVDDRRTRDSKRKWSCIMRLVQIERLCSVSCTASFWHENSSVYNAWILM